MTQRRYLAIACPTLSADRWRRAQDRAGKAEDDGPLALIEKHRGALRIAAIDQAAQATGLKPGMTLADARVRVTELQAVDHDPVADQRWLDQLAGACGRYTPTVAIDLPDTILLDITGCTHLFGGEAALGADAAKRLNGMGARTRHAFADTPEAAAALARFPLAKGNLHRLPIAALRLGAAAETALVRAGLKTIGDLAARPTTPLTARFGSLATAALDRLLGRADSRIVPRHSLPALVFERRCAEPIARTEMALEILADLLVEAGGALAGRGDGGRCFVARLWRTDGAVRDLAVETGLPTRDPRVVMRLLRERIDALADPLDPGFGFDVIRLWVPVAEPLAAEQAELDGKGRAGADTLAALTDRLGVRVGAEQLCRLIARDTHIPERSVSAVPAAQVRASLVWEAPVPGEPPLRPLHLFDPPQPVEVLAEVPDGPPYRFRWRGMQHQVLRHEGPERIGCEWWRHRDRPGLTRDYYRVEDGGGHRFWIFRHGLYGDEVVDARWYIHGLFA
ncbi:Y-family DNA polymerase [Sphingomonas sp. EC-HK361]|uniref:Y-family DNA polymerase n=1 Tax=Sphingomonas sp. EC-HK361 TaxID=2038397 RepID=UPI002D79AD2A|nr:DNA polymerase Y family protein [Sphingomonas sp. EC-HK361]